MMDRDVQEAWEVASSGSELALVATGTHEWGQELKMP